MWLCSLNDPLKFNVVLLLLLAPTIYLCIMRMCVEGWEIMMMKSCWWGRTHIMLKSHLSILLMFNGDDKIWLRSTIDWHYSSSLTLFMHSYVCVSHIVAHVCHLLCQTLNKEFIYSSFFPCDYIHVWVIGVE
jgi:hypothetical protein